MLLAGISSRGTTSYWSLCEGSATVQTTGSMDAGDPSILHTYWAVGCTVPGQVGEFAADFRYSEVNDTLEMTYDDGTSDTWYHASSASWPQPSFVGEWQATDAYDGSAMRLTITGDGASGYLVVWADEYWSLCVRTAAIQIRGEVRKRDRLAELHPSDPGPHRHRDRLQAHSASDRIPLRPVRRSPGTRVQRWPAADRPALVQQWACSPIHARG